MNELIVGRAADIDGLDPSLSTTFTTLQVMPLMYEGLTGLDSDLNVVPRLAESWEFSADGLQLTMHLRPGVTFHDGTTLDSSDVVASIERLQDEKTASPAASNFAAVTSVEAPDDQTVVMTLDQPRAALLAALADPAASIFPSESIVAGTLKDEPVGTGPYSFDSWTRGENLKLKANPAYWGPAPANSGIEFRVIPDEASVAAAVRSGDLDFAVLDDPVVAKQLDGTDATVYRMPSINYHALMLQGRRAPLTDVRVRQAISCAIDRQGVVDAAAFGEGQVVGPITIPAYASDPADAVCPTRDVDKAKALLAEAGLADGFSLETIVSTGQYATSLAEAQTLQAQLKDAGINLDLVPLESDVYGNRWLEGDFDAAVALNSGKADPDTMYGRYFLSDGSLNTVAGFASDELDAALTKGAQETDPSARTETYKTVSDLLLTETPWVWLFSGYDYRVAGPGTTGFEAMPNGSLQNLAETSAGS